VFATARRLEDLASLEAKGIETLALTVDDPQSVLQCYAEIERRVGSRGLDYLVNNAYVNTRELLHLLCHSLTVRNRRGRSESTEYQKCLGSFSSIC
jgi:NAD(P)-dependent dehydrogenase (short-subunit alcohol dehydrogenase family)